MKFFLQYCASFHTKSLKSNVCFILTAHLNFDAKLNFSPEVLDLYLGLIKFACTKVDSHT